MCKQIYKQIQLYTHNSILGRTPGKGRGEEIYIVEIYKNTMVGRRALEKQVAKDK
jgi:hypothetical protein